MFLIGCFNTSYRVKMSAYSRAEKPFQTRVYGGRLNF